MKIALIHDHLNQIGGAEKVLKEFTEIYPQAPIFSLIYDKKITTQYFPAKKIISSFIQSLPFGVKLFKWYLPLMAAAAESLNVKGYDLILSDSSAFAKGVISDINTLHLCYCHTPTRYLWSDSWEYIEELKQSNFLIKKFLPLILTQFRQWDFLAAQRVDKFIANSHFVAKRIKKFYKRESEVIYPPVNTDKFYINPHKEKYFVALSRLRPYKRVDLAIETFNELRLPLIIIGGGWEIKYLKKIARENIQFLGEIQDDKLKAKIISQAQALIHPQEEDFGIAAIEAMSAGIPVIAYKAGGALETIIENKTGIFFEEQTWECLADTVVNFDSGQFKPQEIKNHAENFSASRFRRQIAELVEKEYSKFKAGCSETVELFM